MTVDEQKLLTYYNKLQDINKGKVIGTAKTLAELQVSVSDELTISEEPEENRLNWFAYSHIIFQQFIPNFKIGRLKKSHYI